jgi:prepilin-type N-terminal cleavage/methylation domain-containing protein
MRLGFSLVELSIVLVILGLLTGGIITGQSLIRAAELRSVTVDLSKYQAAVITFRDKYFALPGDMSNATDFWGSAGTCDSTTSYTDVGSGTDTCNGTGDGVIFWRGNGTLLGGHENYRAWQHLVNSGLIAGQYTGTTGPSPSAQMTEDLIGTNIPKIRYNRGLEVGVAFRDPNFATTLYETKNDGGNMLLMSTRGHPNKYIESSGFIPEDAWKIDTKLDDGKVVSGRVTILRGYWFGCATTASAADAVYDLQQASNPECPLVFRLGM